jgi:subfamily B ATP-binding cassette protein MsbA
MQGRLSLTIAHRLSTVRHADEIIVLAKGTVAERGTHPELIKKPKGLYRKLFDLQSATGKVSL